MEYRHARALELLRQGSGLPTAAFREGQEEAIRHVVEGRGRLLVIQKTGWGKSFVYFIATKLLREAGAGPALLVSPLLALMRNQIEAAERMGVRAVTINANNQDDWRRIEQQIAKNQVDILLISPERLANEHFRTTVLGPLAARVSLLVIDEAHCISDWGHDFRPHYRLIERTTKALPSNMRLLATTATANDRVMHDLESILGPGLHVVRGGLGRPSLTLQTIRMPSQAERLAWIAERLATLKGSGIIYTLTISDAKLVADWLGDQGFNVLAYHGELEAQVRIERETLLLEDRVQALVATTALGMGYDKPDLSFVIHYQMPGSVVSYYQQVGRAGRGINAAYGVLLSGTEEARITNWFIVSAFPSRSEVNAVLQALAGAPDGLSVNSLMAAVNMSKGRIQKTLDLLSLESPSPIVKVDTRWKLTAAELSEALWERAERLTELRRAEGRQMEEYLAAPFGQHMEFLIRALDGDPSGLTPPTLPPLPTTAGEDMIQRAVTFLQRTSIPIIPRAKWPHGGNIQPHLRAQPGRALCTWDDAGWGKMVRIGKCHDHRFADELVTASAAMIRAWAPQPAPEWVTAIPSLRYPDLVPDFAQRLAKALGLPFHAALVKTRERPPQATMHSSPFQAQNVKEALETSPGSMPTGPVLLVDDTVNSRWTLTVAASLLLEQGVSAVLPMVLAEAGTDE